MIRFLKTSIALAMLVVAGCADGNGAGSPENDARKPEVFANTVREAIARASAEYPKAPVACAMELQNLVENLGDLSGRPTGDQTATYEEIQGIAKELVSTLNKGKASSSAKEQLDKLVELGNKLPGAEG
ncbi:hypothetical protein [Planctomycetes bacterium Pan216]